MSAARAAGTGRALPGRFRPAWPSVRDAAIAAVITVIAVAAAYAEAHPARNTYFTAPYHQPQTPTAEMLFVAFGGVALAWRHRYPRLVICATTAATIAYTLPGNENGSTLLLPAVALGTYAVVAPVRWAVAWTIGLTAVLMAVTAANDPLGTFGGATTLIPANNVVALFAGIAIANRHAYVESRRVQAARQAAQDAQRRVEEERLRIARELHDVVAHTMATITVQAAAATQLLRDRPDDAAESLKAIRAASKDGLRELRAILDVLRSAGGEAGEFADPTHPTPGLARLDALVAGVRAAGLPVTVRITGQLRDLPAVTDLSAFRIIQEALTNTIRHAGPATATVTVDYGSDALSIEVTDTGRGPAPAAGAAYAAFDAVGHGLRGMRERATAAGGTIEIGPLPGGGFRVAARLPLDRRTGAAPRAEAAQAAQAAGERATR
jgi:signal transduction histidine kinase